MAADQNGRRILGITLLLVVNVVWVLSAEATKYLFVDLNFKRPLFTTYIKSCMFTVFLFRYLMCGPQTFGPADETSTYNKLERQNSDDESFENESLTNAEFEPITYPSDLESEVDSQTPKRSPTPNAEPLPTKKRHVRFSLFREVRRLPERIANEAKLARLPYRPPTLNCEIKMTPILRYTFYFAPLWVLSSTTYQAALVYASVSTVNLISSSASLFVLVFAALFSSHISDRFTWLKLVLVLINLSGVAIVSQFSGAAIGAALSLLSSVSYAIYIVIFSIVSRKTGQVDMNLMFGVIGLFSFVVLTPFIVIAHHTGIEPQLPLPTQNEMLLIFFNSLIGTIFSDYLWLYATLLTNSLIASISLTMTIPLSLIADIVFRLQFPNMAQLIAAIPIMTSFIGASLISNKQAASQPQSINEFQMTAKKRLHDGITFSKSTTDETENLMETPDELEI